MICAQLAPISMEQLVIKHLSSTCNQQYEIK
jgi:hypothetical protein